MSKEIKKTLSNRLIVSNTHTNQFYCKRCKTSSNYLYIVEGYSYCSKCTPIKDLPKHNQSNERIV